ncbi:hypothetical protein [Acinetobacter rongchengensis]|uniref:hypothetical protein n=1 Tax=Acinetobacter rongchengensis TaxID=2419601 RepID=UPI0011C49DB2|nr:hypothetical protein [Acinetobacter rongchengensis]
MESRYLDVDGLEDWPAGLIQYIQVHHRVNGLDCNLFINHIDDNKLKNPLKSGLWYDQISIDH